MRAASAVSITFTATPTTRGIIYYCVSGVIDATTRGTFGTHLDEITAAAHPFVLDLTGVPFISVGGLSLIETLAHTTARLDIRWALAAQYSLHRFLTLLNIDAHIPSFDTDEAAVAHLRPSG
ncbi:STAS domain-containing protein [Rhodococcus qingshengii]|uniref:STAS domain-containing protein n=1 Tax=Rhodococcus qingshengii TaxID=334542 RepID=UPI001BEA8409|nr:STAS domain-containing protein [Rhodococcus qingshengii]MBT2275431.1 STAS domain-containing protein [Rhodococcus qingshengii]